MAGCVLGAAAVHMAERHLVRGAGLGKESGSRGTSNRPFVLCCRATKRLQQLFVWTSRAAPLRVGVVCCCPAAMAAVHAQLLCNFEHEHHENAGVCNVGDCVCHC